MAGQKRKRGQQAARLEEVIDVQEGEDVDGEEQLEKEKRVWDAFREEHYEAIEQLPLTLHRQYTLLEELDRQVAGHTAGLLSVVSDYVSTRIKLQERLKEHLAPIEEDPQAKSGSAPDTEPMAINERPPESQTEAGLEPKGTRAMLSQIASLTENYIRASEEKLNVAEAAYSSVDRQVRILEQAIKEQQQTMIKSGISSEDEILSVAPATWIPPLINPYKIDEEDSSAPTNTANAEGGDEAHENAFKGRKRRGRPKGASTNKPENTTEGGPKVKLLLGSAGDQEPDTEELYCTCQQKSYGDMIACDMEGCEIEWFHIACLGWKELPHENIDWYCPQCLPRLHAQKGKRRSSASRRRRR